MIEIVPLPAGEEGRFEDLTFPLFRPLLRDRARGLALAARALDQAAGLALAEPAAQRLLSIAVRAPWRGRGVATRLLERMEGELSAAGCREVQATYLAGQPSTAALERLFARRGFDPPQPRMLVCRAEIARLRQSPFAAARLSPRAGEVVRFAGLEAGVRRHLRRELEDAPFCPAWAHPFGEEERIEPANSVFLVRAGRVEGWMITHRIAPDTVRYSRLFVRPGLPRGTGLALAGLAVCLQAEHLPAAPLGSMDLEVANRMMLNFLARHLRPYLYEVSVSKQVRKALGARPAGGARA